MKTNNLKTGLFFKSLYVLFLFVLLIPHSEAQVVYEPTWKSSYDFLSRLAQRGIIELDDVIQPISRETIQTKLDELYQRKSDLTPLEKQELNFYLKDYAFDRYTFDTLKKANAFKSFFGKEDGDRFRWISWHKDDFSVNLQPLIGASLDIRNGETVFKRNSGFSLYGYIKKRIGYSFLFNEINESGPFVDATKEFTPKAGYLWRYKTESIQNTDFRTNIAYSWDWGNVTVGRDQITWGYGAQGKLVLSEKAPAYPFVRIDVKPISWLNFNMAHISLNSLVLDSNTVQPTKVNRSQIDFIEKNMTTHSFIITPFKGFTFSFGESVIYNNRIKLGYLIPLSFYRAQSHSEGEGTGNNTLANGQMFLQLSSRNNIKNTHAYFTFFIDEMSFKDFFNRLEMKNQTGYTIGLSVTNLPLKNFYFITEYTRTRPYNYQHFIPAQTYTNSNYNLGHWIGSNADQWYNNVNYRIIRGLKAEINLSLIRKGSIPSEGEFLQDSSEKGNPFLWGEVFHQRNINASLQYELTHDLHLRSCWEWVSLSGSQEKDFQTLILSLRYGF